MHKFEELLLEVETLCNENNKLVRVVIKRKLFKFGISNMLDIIALMLIKHQHKETLHAMYNIRRIQRSDYQVYVDLHRLIDSLTRQREIILDMKGAK